MMKELFLACLLVPCLSICRGQDQDKRVSLAMDFLDLLQQGKYDQAAGFFDTVVSELVPPEKLEEIWNTVNAQAGVFREHFDTRTEEIADYYIVYLACRFAHRELDIKLVFDREMKVAGFFFVPPQPKEEYQPPGYDNPENYTEEDIEIITGDYRLPGKITVPAGKNQYPLVILVHGSGPNDMDETIGPSKPFRDLAVGLAGYGIATLRYDKRTKIYGSRIDPSRITLVEETIEDALSAIALGRSRKEVRGVILLGHSLGAFAAPRIARETQGPDAVIMMAGNARPLEELVREQMNYILSADGLTSAEEKSLRELEEKIGRVKGDSLSSSTPAEKLPLGLPASYWLYLKNYDPISSARQLNIPILILQGERDYQVTMEDFGIWKKNLGSMEGVEMKSYPKLNHLFMEGEGKSLPAEYSLHRNMPEYLIRDIAEWIVKIIPVSPSH